MSFSVSTSAAELDAKLVSIPFLLDPYPTLSELREQDPVHWSDSIGGWVLTRYDDIMVTFKDTDEFSNENRLGRATHHLPPESRSKFTAFEDHYKTKGLLHSDPPDHTRLRKLFLAAFTPKTVEAMRPRIQAIVDELLDAVEPKGRMEVIHELAFALPIRVLCEILGVPLEDRMKFKDWADRLLAFQGMNKPPEAILLAAQDALLEARAFLAHRIQLSREGPQRGLIRDMVVAETDGGKLTEAEIINTCVTLLVAGHETTTSLIGNSLLTLLKHPDQWEAVKADRALMTPAIEECLRFESPVARQPRLMKADAELGGKQIKTGQMVFQMLNAGNRDPKHFKNAETFDIRRSGDSRHMAFGYGMHFCIGAALSRMEGQVVFPTILNRFPNIRLIDEDAHWDPTKPNSRVLKNLHVTW